MSRLMLITSRGLRPNALKLVFQATRSQEVKAIALERHLSRFAVTATPNSALPTSSASSRAARVSVHGQWQGIHTSGSLWEMATVKTPQFPESVAEGDVKFTVKVGDQVGADSVVMEIETDKTTMPVMSPINGIIREILVKDGQTVKAGQELFRLEKTAGGPPPPPAAAAAAPPPPPPKAASPPPAAAPRPPSPPPPTAAAPPPRPPPPPPPKAGAPPSPPRAAVGAIPVSNLANLQVKVPPADYSRAITGTRTEQRVKMNRMRLKIAQRLKEAQNTNAMLTTFNEIDMSFAMEFRKANLDAFQKKYGIKLGFMSIFSKACAHALQDQPVINAVIDGSEIVYRDYVDISVAVATPKGLVVPVIRNVECMNYADVEIALAALGDKAKKGAISVEDMDGGTFTISNGGVFGSLLGTPIINPPQSAILGMHGIFERPIAVKGQVVVRPMMYVALTYDHRLVDGREAVLFLRKIKAGVEDPRIILAGL